MDYKYKNFGNSQLSSEDYSFTRENETINSLYQGTHNIRIGAEYNYEIFAFRGGYGYTTSPFQGDAVPSDYDGSGNLISFGLGIQDGGYSLDIAYLNRTYSQFQTPYQVAEKSDPDIKREIDHTNIMVTLGYQW